MEGMAKRSPTVRSLRDRLAQFTASPPPDRRTEKIDRRAALEALVARGTQWMGSLPEGCLRIEEPVSLPARAEVSTAFFARAGLEDPRGDGPWVVLDTETTGLESGTGTVVFLVALLRWSDGEGRLVQYFLPEPAGESCFWTAVAREVEGASLVISYNGKSFDLPRMRTRMRLSRIGAEALEGPHADLLHPTRRVVTSWLASSRLIEVERGLLGLRRTEDLPGSQAPEVYRSLQTEGRDRGLCAVVEHNRADVLHLVELFCRLERIYCGSAWRDLPAEARLDLARVLARRGEVDDALEMLTSVRGSEDAKLRARAHRLAAHHLRRAGEHARAEGELLAALEAEPAGLDTRVQLAKLYEHRLKDLPRAHEMTRAALSGLHRQREWAGASGGRVGEDQALLHRLRRLERRMGGPRGEH